MEQQQICKTFREATPTCDRAQVILQATSQHLSSQCFYRKRIIFIASLQREWENSVLALKNYALAVSSLFVTAESSGFSLWWAEHPMSDVCIAMCKQSSSSSLSMKSISDDDNFALLPAIISRLNFVLEVTCPLGGKGTVFFSSSSSLSLSSWSLPPLL
jgi:hypothetical protein